MYYFLCLYLPTHCTHQLTHLCVTAPTFVLVGVDLALALPVQRSAKGIIMADHAAGDDIFVFTGGRAPQHVVNAIIDESVEEIDEWAFRNNRNLRSVVCHDRLLKVGVWGEREELFPVLST